MPGVPPAPAPPRQLSRLPEHRHSPGAAWPRAGAAARTVPRCRTPRAAAAPSYLLARGCPRGRAARCRARLPRLPRLRTAHVTLEEIGSVLGRKSNQRAPRCWSTPCPHAPWGSSCLPAWQPPGCPDPPHTGPWGHPAGTPRPPGPDGPHSRTHHTLHPGRASPASAAGERGWVRVLGPQAGTTAMAQPRGCWTLALGSLPGCGVRLHEPRRSRGRAAPAQLPLTVGTGAGRSSTKLLGKSPLRCRHCPSHQPSASVCGGQGRRQRRAQPWGRSHPRAPSPC